jgi:hypothetical protein
MNYRPRPIAITAAAAVLGLLPVTGTQAQWYSSYPTAGANRYGVPPQQPYAVEVAPNTYVIHRPAKPRVKAHVRCVDCEPAPPAAERPRRTHADRALIDELAKRHVKTKVIHTTKTVREKPVVIEHERLVDDPPRIIERRHITEDAPSRGLIHQRREVGTEEVVIEPGGRKTKIERPAKTKHVVQRPAKTKHAMQQPATPTRAAHAGSKKRVIKADAEVTILGPDRMSIRLFRKGGGDDANAELLQ